MSRRKKGRRMTPSDWAEWRRTRLDALPPGVPIDYYGEMCQRIDTGGPWGCEGGRHALSAAVEWVRQTDYADREAEVLAWVGSLGGVCDCRIRDVVLRRIQRLFDGYDRP
jgi:hypothetical protein